ncbi:hypothetical protein LPJ66_006459, partial [Kickxella alabastrina]
MAYAKKVVAVGLEPGYTVDDGDTFVAQAMAEANADFAILSITQPTAHTTAGGYLALSDVVIKSATNAYCTLGSTAPWTPGNVDLVAQQVEYGEHIGLRRVLAPLSEPLVDYACSLMALLQKGDAPMVVRLAAHEWRKWNRVRMMCGHNARLQVALDLDLDPDLSLEQWRAEPVQLAIVAEALFIRNAAGFPVLRRGHQAAVQQMMDIGAAVAVRCGANANAADHVEYIRHLAAPKDLDADSAASEAYHDVLQVPLQPLMDHLDADTYATFEADLPKYDAYERALARALSDLTKPEILLMV